MGRTNWTAIILGGGVLVGGAYVFLNWKKLCPDILGAENCTGDNPIADIYNQLPTIADNPSTNVYRSTRINTNPNAQKNAATAIANQQKFRSPAVIQKSSYIKPANTTARKNDFCSTGNNQKNYPNICGFYTDSDFNSFNTITLNKISVR